MTTRFMYDGINTLAVGIASHIATITPRPMVAGYLDNIFEWSPAEWALMDGSVRVGIVTRAQRNFGDVLDVENGDASPNQTGDWITMRKAMGYHKPTIYCDLNNVPAVRIGTGRYVLGVDYDIWVAHYDGSTVPDPVPGPGTLAAKFAAKQFLATGRWDVSAVYDDGWPHRCS